MELFIYMNTNCFVPGYADQQKLVIKTAKPTIVDDLNLWATPA